MTNTNCLDGIKCPKCGSEERFRIQSDCLVTMTDDGTEHVEDVEWSEDSSIVCCACDHYGIVKDFHV